MGDDHATPLLSTSFRIPHPHHARRGQAELGQHAVREHGQHAHRQAGDEDGRAVGLLAVQALGPAPPCFMLEVVNA